MYAVTRTSTVRVLHTLSESGALNISDLARKSELAFSYMFRLLPEMERDGLVVSEKKGREKIYELTDYGRDLYNVIYRRRLLEAVKPQMKPASEVLQSLVVRARPLRAKKKKKTASEEKK